MERFKIAAIVLVLFGGAAGSYLIIKNSASQINFDSSKEIVNKTAQYIEENPIRWVNDLLLSSQNNLGSIGTDLSGRKNEGNDFNLTQTFMQSLLAQMQQDGQDGNDSLKGLKIDDRTSRKIIEEAALAVQASSTALLLSAEINITDLKISQDNSIKAKKQYIEAIGQISQNRIAGFNKNYIDVLEDVIKKKDVSSALQLSEIYKNMADDYLNLAVPFDFASVHQKLITHFKNAEIVYSTLADYKRDPLMVSIAVEAIDQLVLNAESNQALFEQEIKESGL